MYKALYKPNQLITGKGNDLAIVTGWTPRAAVANKLDAKDYAVIGNLYSPTRGLSPLIRNLLLNPDINFLVILSQTKEDKNSGSCQCLFDFINNGFTQGISDTGKPVWLVNSSITGFIDYEISQEALHSLRETLIVFYCISIEEIKRVIEKIHFYHQYKITRPSFHFSETAYTPSVFPGDRYGHIVRGKTIAETWVKILHRIKTTGTIRPTGYDGQWQELIDLMAIIIDEPEDFYFPEPNYLPIDREYLTNYLPQILEDAPYQEGVKYTYGQRLRSWFGKDQIEDCINKLIREVDAASAVMNLWDSGSGTHERVLDPINCDATTAIARFDRWKGESDHDHGGSPCLNHIWLRVVNGNLSLTATFRSNDMFAAWPANAMGLRALQRLIVNEINRRSDLNLGLDPLITISQSAHIYDDCWENVDSLIDSQLRIKPDYHDSVGNFIIEIKDEQIVIERVDLQGNLIFVYKGRNPLILVREIAFDAPTIKPDHIGYLGVEIQKAFNCLKVGVDYQQDRL